MSTGSATMKPIKKRLPDGRSVIVQDHRVEVKAKGKLKGWSATTRFRRSEVDRIEIIDGAIALISPGNLIQIRLAISSGIAC